MNLKYVGAYETVVFFRDTKGAIFMAPMEVFIGTRLDLNHCYKIPEYSFGLIKNFSATIMKQCSYKCFIIASVNVLQVKDLGKGSDRFGDKSFGTDMKFKLFKLWIDNNLVYDSITNIKECASSKKSVYLE